MMVTAVLNRAEGEGISKPDSSSFMSLRSRNVEAQ